MECGEVGQETPIGQALRMFYEKMPSAARACARASRARPPKVSSTLPRLVRGRRLATFAWRYCSSSSPASWASQRKSGMSSVVKQDPETKQQNKFIKNQFRPLHMFGEVGELGQRMARCLIKNGSVLIPWCFAFMAGFSCKSRSAANNKSTAHINCVHRRDTTAETSYTWASVYAYIAKALPSLLLC